MAKIQIVPKRIIAKQEFRQALIEGPGGTPQGERIDTPAELLSGLEHVQGILARLNIGRAGLKTRLISLFRAILPRSDREASIWRVFSVEYGPDNPVTRSINPEAHSTKSQNFVDHYQRRV